MSNDGAVIQGDIVAQLDEIGFRHKHCMPTRTYRAVVADLRPYCSIVPSHKDCSGEWIEDTQVTESLVEWT